MDGETRPLAGGATARWSESLAGTSTYTWRLEFRPLAGGSAAMNGTLRPGDCDGDLHLRLVGQFLQNGEPAFGADGTVHCDERLIADA
jgi:hypothetical protein